MSDSTQRTFAPDTPSLNGLIASIDRLYDDVVVPARATAGSAGYDVRAYLRGRRVRCSDGVSQSDREAAEREGEWTIALAPGEMALVPLGFRTRLPAGIEAQVRPRSGQAFKQALTIPNAPGTVDSDYAEEWMVIVRNDAPVPRTISHGERIAQVVFARFAELEFREADVQRSTERAGGFGSTGST
ncbi:MAG TPA: dUTP diphosphatase [Gemmatimonadaceae bacterium]|jgi:dUTP pyrophosphatase|nr:dUTP diphosphatase [Gemmatimonadaceae bacterium]